jgi:uncharacterized protein (DUF2147 family)
MKRILVNAGVLLLAAAIPVTASAQAALEGQWTNPKRSVVVKVAPCGDAYCGTVVRASEKAKANARRGGTPSLVGTRILSGLKAAGDGRYRGKVFVPKRNIYAAATVRQVNANVMEVEGCALLGLLCDEQRWTRIGG